MLISRLNRKQTIDKDGTPHITEKVRKPKSGEWMQTYTSADGKTPIVEPLAINYDYTGMLNNIQSRRQIILQKCNVPQRMIIAVAVQELQCQMQQAGRRPKQQQ